MVAFFLPLIISSVATVSLIGYHFMKRIIIKSDISDGSGFISDGKAVDYNDRF